MIVTSVYCAKRSFHALMQLHGFMLYGTGGMAKLMNSGKAGGDSSAVIHVM